MSLQSVFDRLTSAYAEFCGARNLAVISADEQMLSLSETAPRADHTWLKRFTRIWETHENDPEFSSPLNKGLVPEEFGFRLDPLPVFLEKSPSSELHARLRRQSGPDTEHNWVIWHPEMDANEGILLSGDSPSALIDLLSEVLQEAPRP